MNSLVMSSICKILSTSIGPRPNTIQLCTRRSSCKGESGDKKGDGKKDGEGEPCDPCPCCICPGDSNPSTPTLYDSRKYGHALPLHIIPERFEQVPCIPNGIFRWTAGERLGPGAAKCSHYQAPEYYAYHHMTYYDMHLILRCCRKPCPKTGRKPN